MNELSPSKPLLLINSCGEDGQICLIYRSYRICQPIKKFPAAELIIATIDHIMMKYHLHVRDLEGIVVVSGPGNFTTTKVGITVANTVAWLMNVPILGISPQMVNRHYPFFIAHASRQRRAIIRPQLPPPHITQHSFGKPSL